MIALQEIPGGTAIPVRVRPKAPRDGVDGERNGSLMVSVTEAPEKDKANKSVTKALAKFFGISASQVILLSGQKSRDKRFLLEGIRPAKAMEIIQSADAG